MGWIIFALIVLGIFSVGISKVQKVEGFRNSVATEEGLRRYLRHMRNGFNLPPEAFPQDVEDRVVKRLLDTWIELIGLVINAAQASGSEKKKLEKVAEEAEESFTRDLLPFLTEDFRFSWSQVSDEELTEISRPFFERALLSK